ncbi:hypothetical protein ZWY2020_015670 [Hordeum vulgare]|nr:hypothetical protein ZWY2020_015670 [Hordeum vulgare]
MLCAPPPHAPDLLSAPVGSWRWRARQHHQLTVLPPRGWNSYDSFSWIIDEAAFLDNPLIMAKRLLPHGYQDRPARGGAYGFDIDRWGAVPDLRRFPLSRGGRGFRPIADKVHAMGLKFGIHLMNGISTQAVNANTPILDVRTLARKIHILNYLLENISLAISDSVAMASCKGPWNQYSSSDDDTDSPDVSDESLGPQSTPPSSIFTSDDLEYIEFMEWPQESSETELELVYPDSEEEDTEDHEEEDEEEEYEDVDDSDDEENNDNNEKSTVNGKNYPHQDDDVEVTSKKKKKNKKE